MGGCAKGTEQCLRHCRPYQVPSGTVRYSQSISSRSVMNWPMNYEIVCRTAPAVPGLLFSRYYLIPPCAVSLVLLGALQVSSVISVTSLLMSYESVCRTAPAPPGLLTTCVPSGVIDYQFQCALGYRQVSNLCGQSHPVVG